MPYSKHLLEPQSTEQKALLLLAYGQADGAAARLASRMVSTLESEWGISTLLHRKTLTAWIADAKDPAHFPQVQLRMCSMSISSHIEQERVNWVVAFLEENQGPGLSAKLRALRLRRLPVGGDGWCQWRTLSLLLRGTEEAWKEVRREVAVFMTNNNTPPFLPGLYPQADIELVRYQLGLIPNRRMKNGRQRFGPLAHWGDNLTLFGAAECFSARIVVVQPGECPPQVLTPEKSEAQFTMHVVLSMQHYDPLLPFDNMVVPGIVMAKAAGRREAEAEILQLKAEILRLKAEMPA
eukprot:Hpha_TRINITY_DN3822_c0_g1::TRINITY_DN3822_c0_g1_i1::g.44671::m.44671